MRPPTASDTDALQSCQRDFLDTLSAGTMQLKRPEADENAEAQRRGESRARFSTKWWLRRAGSFPSASSASLRFKKGLQLHRSGLGSKVFAPRTGSSPWPRSRAPRLACWRLLACAYFQPFCALSITAIFRSNSIHDSSCLLSGKICSRKRARSLIATCNLSLSSPRMMRCRSSNLRMPASASPARRSMRAVIPASGRGVHGGNDMPEGGPRVHHGRGYNLHRGKVDQNTLRFYRTAPSAGKLFINPSFWNLTVTGPW